MDNMLKLIGSLIEDPKWEHLKTSADKWDRLCEIFSRPGFRMSWRARIPLGFYTGRELSDHGELEFFINDKLSFSWKFSPGHFQLRIDAGSAGSLWTKFIDQSYRLSEYKTKLLNQLSGWFIDKDPSDLSEEAKLDLRYLCYGNLESNEYKLRSLSFLSFSRSTKALSPILRWIDQVPQADERTQLLCLEGLLRLQSKISMDLGLHINDLKIPLSEQKNRMSIIVTALNDMRVLSLHALKFPEMDEFHSPAIDYLKLCVLHKADSIELDALFGIFRDSPRLKFITLVEFMDAIEYHRIQNKIKDPKYRSISDIIQSLVKTAPGLIQSNLAVFSELTFYLAKKRLNSLVTLLIHTNPDLIGKIQDLHQVNIINKLPKPVSRSQVVN